MAILVVPAGIHCPYVGYGALLPALGVFQPTAMV